MKRYLVTGLCMQGNKGGPALALALVDAIRREIPEAQFVFAVREADDEWALETRWAQRYGFEICKSASLSCLIPPFCFGRGRRQRLANWWQTLRRCDALIQMSAICYIGPPAGSGSLRAMLRSPRVFDFLSALVARRPMRAWTQSYGPLSTGAVRFFAKRDLRRQPVVFCRGDDCVAAVRELLPHATALSFPDVAVTLRFDKAWGATYVAQIFPSLSRFVTLSPSAMLYSRDSARGTSNSHVRQCRVACAHLAALGYTVLLVPHTLRPTHPDPEICDLAVAELVYQGASPANVGLVREDLSPVELKSIIANAEFHIGARYHSVVAALSAGVPAISLSWHPKYRDLMRPYGMEDYLLVEDDAQGLGSLVEKVKSQNAELRRRLTEKQSDVVDRVRENARLFCALLPAG